MSMTPHRTGPGLDRAAERSPTTALPPTKYQVVLVALLSFNFSVVFFDRNALNFLMPFVKPELGLNNTQVGLLASGLSLTWALSAYLVGRYSDRTGRRKSVIVFATLAFSACSFVSGLASSFLVLFAARLLMGLAEGGILPVSQSLTASQVDPAHRGLAMGVIQNFCSNLIGGTLAPILLVALAVHYGWRMSFYLAGIPGIAAALLIWFFLYDPPAASVRAVDRMSLRAAFGERNIFVCAIISVLMISYLVIGWTFLPLFLVQVRGFSAGTMGGLMAALGLMATIGSFAVPAWSDRAGRKPIMMLVPVIGIAAPLGAMFFDGPVWLLGAILALGWALNGTFSLFMATIPSETVDPRHSATVLGLVLGAGEIFGGGLSPFAAGAMADRFGLEAPLWAMVGLAVASGLVAIALRETAPRIVGARAAAQSG